MSRFRGLVPVVAVAALMLNGASSASASPPQPGPDARNVPVNPPAKLAPPPVVKPSADFNGRVDLPNDYERGAVKLKVRQGLDVETVLRRHGLAARYRYLSPPPFSQWDIAAGIDRNFWVEVPVGAEKQLVSSLARFTEDFEWVNAVWLPNGAGALLTPNDPKYPTNQTYLSWINISGAWDKTVSWSGIIVATLDSGLYDDHQDAGVWKERNGWDYLAEVSMPAGSATDSGCAYGHGTKVSSMAAGDTNNGLGVAGTGFNSGILPIKVLTSGCAYGAKVYGSISYDWPIRWATSQGAHIINMSYDIGSYLPPEMQDALAAAWSAGVTPVAAAGNSNNNHAASLPNRRYPCDASYVICVGGVQSSGGTKWNLSDYGPGFVDVMAPSVNIYGATNQGTADYRADSGTSYASPLTAGVLALLRSIGKTPNQQWIALAQTAQYPSGVDPNGWSTYGLINAGAALWY